MVNLKDETVAASSGSEMSSLDPSTRAMHADDPLNCSTDVSPPMHVSTTFRYASDPSTLKPIYDGELFKEGSTIPAAHVYSRLSGPNTTRLEAILSSLMHGHAVAYGSGLAAFHAMLVFLNPKVIAIGDGYHGCHGVIGLMTKVGGLKKVDLHDEKAWDAANLGKGDVVHVETPLNPTGEAYNLVHFAERAHARGAYLTVDSTFGPPGLQDPFQQGADIVFHSGTKYIGGHSDMLCGVLATRQSKQGWSQWSQLFQERLHLGSTMGSMEGWLGIRSLRTLDLRVKRQSETTTALVKWLDDALHNEGEDADLVGNSVDRVQHASLQKADMVWIKKQMPGGFGPVFSIWMKTEGLAKALPSGLHLFHHATSLGGVESLIEWRKMSDEHIDGRLLRVSIGVEHVDDLKADLRAAFNASN